LGLPWTRHTLARERKSANRRSPGADIVDRQDAETAAGMELIGDEV